ncbi:MAG: glycosyltransferase family 2 protein, partial [Nitrospinota bacterium]
MKIIFWACLSILVYIYAGYPVLLWVMRQLRGVKAVEKKPIFPHVTLIISAYNEARVIRQKLENALALHYPREKLEIIVVSDASTDETDQVVSQYESQGVILLRLQERQGKTVGLNQAVAMAQGEILVFSDANALYDPDAIGHLVANFADPNVGYVTGASCYIKKDSSFVGWCEDLYWKYDLQIKKLESQVESMVGADGTIYAIRKELYTPLQPQDINDFVNPLQIIRQGFRGVFEPKALCYEQTMHHFEEEFRRKVRIVARSLRGLMRERALLNPGQFGFYALELLSHKLLRWFTPVFLLGMAITNIPLWTRGTIYTVTGTLQALFYAFAGLGFLLSLFRVKSHFLYFPYYFCLINLASLCGIWKACRGTVPITWEPERERREDLAKRQSFLVPLVSVMLISVGSVV